MRGVNVGLSGFVEAAKASGWEFAPTVWCAANPSAHVREDAYERIAKMIVDGIAAAGPLDGVYLDLHGAMVAEHLDDGEGEFSAGCARRSAPTFPWSSASICTPMSRRR